jgi:hypothetical protein
MSNDYEPDGYEPDFGEYDPEPDLDFMFETESAFESIGWGTCDDFWAEDW